MRTIYYVDVTNLPSTKAEAEIAKRLEEYKAVYDTTKYPVLMVPSDRTFIDVFYDEVDADAEFEQRFGVLNG